MDVPAVGPLVVLVVDVVAVTSGLLVIEDKVVEVVVVGNVVVVEVEEVVEVEADDVVVTVVV